MPQPLTIPQFVHEDGLQIIAEMKADMEARLAKQLAPGDVETLLINGFAYREQLLRTNINDTARQNLVSFARNTSLDYLGMLVGVTRLPASSALCTVRFNLIDGHGGVVIPENLRVQSTDGKVIFLTTQSVPVAADVFVVDIICECSTPGKVGNGYDLGKISIILDPKPYLTTAANIDIPQGGADDETDDELRERIKLAPASFSVAGPIGAYKFFAKSASSSIVDVSVTSPEPGVVNIYPLLENGTLPSVEILDAVNAICNAEKVRPLTDTVNVLSPSKVDYEIVVDLMLLPDAVEDEVLSVVNENLNKYKSDRINRLGIDVVRSQISALCMIQGKVYSVDVISPALDIVAAADVFTNCIGITVNIVGVQDE